MYIRIITSSNSIHNTLYDDNAECRSSHCLETGAETRIAIHTQIYVVYLVMRGCVRNFYLLKILTSAVTDKFVTDGQDPRKQSSDFRLPFQMFDLQSQLLTSGKL